MQRLATAVVLVPGLWVLIKIAPPWAFLVFVLSMIVVACWESYLMLQARGSRPFKWIGLFGGCLLIWAFLDPQPLLDMPPAFEAGLPLVAVTMISLILGMRLRSSPGEVLDSTMTTFFPLLLVGLPLAYLIALRYMPGEDGEDLLMLLGICVIALDTAAYYVGSHFGRRRLAPRLSPRKTWEGALSGLLASVAAAWIAQAWFYQRLPLHHAIVLGLLLGLAGILGDLVESLFKRAAGVKDSSKLLPGHGGVLDRTDSLMFSAPILYYYYLTFLRVTA